MKLASILFLSAFLGSLPASAESLVLYEATLLSGTNPASGTYDLRFTLHDQSTLSRTFGLCITNKNVQITNGLIQTILDFRLWRSGLTQGWIEAAVRPAGTGTDFIPMKAMVDSCVSHAPDCKKPCDGRCQYRGFRLHTYRHFFQLDPSKPQRGRKFLVLPEFAGKISPSPAPVRKTHRGQRPTPRFDEVRKRSALA